MKTKKIEKLGINPSLSGFGCMHFPLGENGNIDEIESEKCLIRLLVGE